MYRLLGGMVLVHLCAGHIEAQRYELMSSEQAQHLILGVWESHPSDVEQFPGNGYACERNPITISMAENGYSIAADDRRVDTTISTTASAEMNMDLSPIFGFKSDYSVFLANRDLAFLTIPAGQPEQVDETLFSGDQAPVITSRQRVVRLIRCKDAEAIS